MTSCVFYRFKSQKDESRITFDGTGISVFDLKREIILANNLGKANDFDLYVYDASTQQEYRDDTQIIPRSSSVIVKRLPAQRPGKGKAGMYLAGATGNAAIQTSDVVQRSGGVTWHRGAMSKRFDIKEEQQSAPSKASTPVTTIPKNSVTKEDEAAAMAAMFQAQTANWEETQEKMSHATRIYRDKPSSGRGGKPFQHHTHDRPLPQSYVCYRCGQKGHWIQDCPTNNDREFDNKPRIKRTTGIPRSFLKAVENPSKGELTQGVMVTPEGGYVVAQPDSASWQKQVTRMKGLTVAEVRERAPTDPSLACPIDNRLFRDAVKTPCCETSYCEECIQTHLLERDFVCPNCGKKIPSLDKLVADKSMRTKVSEHIDKVIEQSKKDGEEGTISGQGFSSEGADQLADGSVMDDFYSDQHSDVSQMIVDSIPQLQAQISQLSVMMHNPSLPNQVRQTTEMKYHELQMELQQAQALAATLAVATTLQQQQQQQQQQMQNNPSLMGFGIPGYQGNDAPWSTNPFTSQQPAGQDSAYQRLPLNNRRRNLKRDRPSDFLEVGGDGDSKVQRYWE
ncbi:DWNN domain-containing protein [Pisolithus sp. B1]|nr:DWNN domain-containing protein [Pisolithus sp. B1]